MLSVAQSVFVPVTSQLFVKTSYILINNIWLILDLHNTFTTKMKNKVVCTNMFCPLEVTSSQQNQMGGWFLLD